MRSSVLALLLLSEYWPPSVGTTIGTISFIVVCVLGYFYLRSASSKQTLSSETERANSLERTIKAVRDELAQEQAAHARTKAESERHKGQAEAAGAELTGLYVIDVKDLTDAYRMREEIKLLQGQIEFLRTKLIEARAGSDDIHVTAERMPPNERR